VLKGDYTPGQLLTLVGHFAFAVGMRLHFLIFAALRQVPFVALPYAVKVTGILEALEMPSPPMNQVNTGQLIAHIDRSWDLRGELRDRIVRALPAIQERARENTTIALALLQSTSERNDVTRGNVIH
jgi:polysaccharide pyruvyl transferase WcaK-like protein